MSDDGPSGQLDDQEGWGRFYDGTLPTTVERDDAARICDVVAAAFAGAAALWVLAGISISLAGGGAAKDRAFLAADLVAGVPLAALALIAVGMEAFAGSYWSRRLARWSVRVGVATAVVIVVAASYVVAYLLFRDASLGNGSDFDRATQAAIRATFNWSWRLSGILTAAAAAVLSGAALYVARRSDSRPVPMPEASARTS